MKDKKNVIVLMGGPSPERHVSIESGKVVSASLDRSKYNVFPVEILPDGGWKWRDLQDISKLENKIMRIEGKTKDSNATTSCYSREQDADKDIASQFLDWETSPVRSKPNVAFIAMHGAYGEDGCIQGWLELLGVPYTGSGVLASALGMNKVKSKEIFAYYGIKQPDWFFFKKTDWQKDKENIKKLCAEKFEFPIIVKANNLGSSIGVELVSDSNYFAESVEKVLLEDNEVLVEEYIKGIEVTCGVIEEPNSSSLISLPLTEIVSKGSFFDYKNKYSENGAEEITPARVSDVLSLKAQKIAQQTHLSLGCRGFSRTDFIIKDDLLYVLEINTIPGLTNFSLLPKAAKYIGIDFPELLDRLICAALKNKHPVKPGC